MDRLDYKFAAFLLAMEAINQVLRCIVAAHDGAWFWLAMGVISAIYTAYLARGLWRTRP